MIRTILRRYRPVTAVASCAAILILALVQPAAGTTVAITATLTAGTPVPPDFKAQSITWVSPQRGWVLGTIACATGTCTEVIGTGDGGDTWELLGSIDAPIPKLGNPGSGITEVRFATANVGWAFAPELFGTADGGRTWTSMRIPGGGKQVLSLAANSSEVYAVVSPCKYATGICTDQPLTFWRKTLTAWRWTQIPLDLPISFAANVSVYDRTVYVVDERVDTVEQPDRFYASTNGVDFSPRPVPCKKTPDIALDQALPTSRTDVFLLCVGNPGFSKSEKIVYRSTDTGRTERFSGLVGDDGIQSQLAVSPSGNMAVSSWSDGSFMYIDDTHRTAWTMVIGSGDGGAGFNDVVYVSDEVAWVVFGPDDQFSGYGAIMVTRDAGQTWSFVTP
jgi:hypothetical protein